MTSPGGREVGRVSVRVVPDTSGFRQRVKAALEGIDDIEIGIDVNTEGVRQKVQAAAAAAGAGVDAEIGVDVNQGALARIRNAIQNAVGNLGHLDIGQGNILANTMARVQENAMRIRESLERVAISFREVTNSSNNVRGHFQGIQQAARQIGTELRGLRMPNMDREFLNGQSAFQRFSTAVYSGMSRVGEVIGDGFRAAGSAITGFFASSTDGLGQMGRGFTSLLGVILGVVAVVTVLAAVGALIALAGAAITAAWSIAAGAIAAVPAALALVAVPLAAVMLGLDGIKAAAETLEPAFNRLKTAVSDTFERGMTTAFQTLNGIFPTLQTGLVGTATALSNVTRMLATFLVQKPQLDALKATFDNVNTAITGITPGLTAILGGFLQITSQASGLEMLTNVINNLGQSWQESVDKMTAGVNGASVFDQAMVGLEGTLTAVGDGLIALVENGMRAFTTAAPGINQFLNSLTGFFARFNWERLGGAVGNVFGGLGEILDGVDPATITAIEDAFVRLGDVFKDPQFQASIQQFIDGLPAIIDFITKLTELAGGLAGAFGGLAQTLKDQNLWDLLTGKNIGQGGEVQLGGLGDGGFGGLFGDLWNQLTDLQNAFDDLDVPDEIDVAINFVMPQTPEFEDMAANFTLNLDGVQAQIDTLNQQITTGLQLTNTLIQAQTATWNASFAAAMDVINTTILTQSLQWNTALQAALFIMQTTIVGETALWNEAFLVAMTQINATILAQSALWNQTLLTQLQLVGQTILAQTALWNEAFVTAFTLINQTLLTQSQLWNQTMLAQLTLVGQTIIAQTTLWNQAFVTAFALILTTVTTGMFNISTTVNQGMALSTALITAGLAAWQQAFFAGLTTINMLVQAQFTTMVTTVTTSMTNATNAVINGMTMMVTAVTTGMTNIQTVWGTGWALVVQTTISAVANIVAVVTSGMAQLAAAVVSAVAQIVAAFVSGWAQVVAAVISGMAQIVAAVVAGMAQLVAAIIGGVAQAVAAFQSLVTQGLAALESMVSGAARIGAAVIQGLVNAIRAGIGAVVSAARAVAEAALNAAMSALGVASPSKEFKYIGRMVIAGLVMSLEAGKAAVASASADVANAALRAHDKAIATYRGGKWDLEMWSDLPNNIESVKSIAMSDFAGSIDDDGYGEHIIDKVCEALAQWGVHIDRDGVAKMVNNSNRYRKRR